MSRHDYARQSWLNNREGRVTIDLDKWERRVVRTMAVVTLTLIGAAVVLFAAVMVVQIVMAVKHGS